MERPRHFQCRRPFRRRQCCPTLRTFCRPPRVRSRKIARLCREDNRFVCAPANDRVCVAALVLLSRRPAARALPVLKSRGKNPATVQRNLVARWWNGYREGHRLLISPVGEKETGKAARWRDLRYWQLLTCRIRSV